MESALQKKVEEVLAQYNAFHAPEATAELVEIPDNAATTRFTGSFCRTCGV